MKIAAFLIPIVLFFGCGTVPKEAADALAEGWTLLKPYAEAGIRADVSLSEQEQAIRLRHAEAFGLLIEEVGNYGH